MKLIRVIKAKILNKQELDAWFENQMKQQGFPSDEELHKEYDAYVNSEEGEVHQVLGLLPTFEEYKQMALNNFSNKNVGNKPEPRKWHLDDEWIDTDDDPIEEPKDVEI